MRKISFFQLDSGQGPVYTSPPDSVGTLYAPVSTGHHERGFTLVEIIVTFLLISVLSVVVISRLSSSTAFNAVVLRDQIVSMARSARQNSLGRADVSLTITPSADGSSVALVTSHAGGTIESFDFSLSGVALRGDINNTDSCAATSGASVISSVTPMTLNFDELGDLEVSGVTGSTGAVDSALRVCINDSAESSVCVAPSGFAYVGDCDV